MSRKSAWQRLLAVALLMSLLMTACSSTGEGDGEEAPPTSSNGGADTTLESSESDTPTTQATEDGDDREQTLVVAYPDVAGGFDGDVLTPGTQEVVHQLYDTLFTYEVMDTGDGAPRVDGGSVEPLLAESYEVSDDGLVYDIKLREGVLSPYGNEMTADSVVWGWEKSLFQERTGRFILQGAANVESVEAVDTYTVRYTLTQPSPLFLRALAVYTPSVYDHVVMEENATEDDPFGVAFLERNSAGFGPYYVESVSPGEEAIFAANPNYFREQPYFTRIIMRQVPEASTRLQLLQAGEVQYAKALDFNDLARLVNNPDPSIKVEVVPETNQHARALFNTNFEPYDNKALRQAMNYAIDHARLVEAGFEGLAQVSKSALTPVFSCYTDEYYPYDEPDLERARELLAEAGFPDGLEVTLQYAQIRSGVWEETYAVQIQDMLSEIGITVNLERLPNAEMLARSARGERDLPFFTFDEAALILDPGYGFFNASHPDSGGNRNDTNVPELTALIDEGNQTLDPDERCEIFRQAQELHMEEALWIGDAIVPATEAMAPDIEGYIWYPENHIRWYTLERS